jgi:hypothetical protein
MEAVAQPVMEWPRPLAWLREFLKEELAPYPGRTALVARMVICATLVMLITMTFQLPFGMHGAIFTFFVSRESPRATMKAVRTILIAFSLAAGYVFLGALISLGDPMLRVLWIIVSLFIAFFAIHTMTDYAAATGFGIVVAITLPVWDMHIPTELKVERTLWVLGQTSMACAIVLLVELAFAGLGPGDDLVRPIAQRLAAVEELLKSYAAGGFGNEQDEITRLAMAGTSRLRRLLIRSTHSLHYREQVGALVALVGRLVDIAANLTDFNPSENARTRMRKLAEIIAGIRADLLSGRVPTKSLEKVGRGVPTAPIPIQRRQVGAVGTPRPTTSSDRVARSGDSEASQTVPLLGEMERTVSLLHEAFVGSRAVSAYSPAPSGDPAHLHSATIAEDGISEIGARAVPGSQQPRHARTARTTQSSHFRRTRCEPGTARAPVLVSGSAPDEPPSRLFVPDALSNPDHIRFALKGCLAASLCYLIYTALDWAGISTAVITCVLTALTTIGASRQKQVLRIAGAIVGGFIFGMGAQIFILPYLDSIGGFTVLFVTVTILGAWFATSSPRLSYFGVQLALAFFVVNLQEFGIETSLTFPRDRVIGILLGLFMMWLVFDQLWGTPAVVEMKNVFISLLHSLAKLVRAPFEPREGIEQTHALRETINNDFDKVRALSDAVLFEFGPSRQQDLTFRSRITRWQPHLRMLYITRLALLKYRCQLPGFELARPVYLAQLEFDEHLAATLDAIADRLKGETRARTESLQDSFARVEQTIQTSAVSQGVLSSHLQTFLQLSRRITSLAVSLDQEIGEVPHK